MKFENKINKLKNILERYREYISFLLLLTIILAIYNVGGFDISILSKSFVRDAGTDISIPTNINELRKYLKSKNDISEITICDDILKNEPLMQQIYENIYPVKISQLAHNILCFDKNDFINKEFLSCKINMKLEDMLIYECH